MAASGAGGCPGTLRLVISVYEDHSVVSATLLVHLPCDPLARRVGHRRLNLGRAAFAGLSTDDILHLVGQYLADADDQPLL